MLRNAKANGMKFKIKFNLVAFRCRNTDHITAYKKMIQPYASLILIHPK